jgi:uridine kinase/ribulose-5-phosphate 4-epimerase/fuculose-1-phosphate aldolase
MKTKIPFIIGITGPSGVGKTTLSKLISYLYNKDETLILSGDDLHKWERNDPNWEIYTHLNPEANNLEQGFIDLLDLKNNKSISRQLYNHTSGKFDPAIKINSRPVIIYEGLHSLYDQNVLDILDLKIFVDTDDTLTKEWKLKRDTTIRGYSEQEVTKSINRRIVDNEKFIIPQKNQADVIFKFYKNRKGKIELSCENLTKKSNIVISKIKEKYKLISNFLDLNTQLSMDFNLTQGIGGNFSIKNNGKIIIKSSGKNSSEINFSDGFAICKNDNKIPNFNNENEYNEFIELHNLTIDRKPSMETGFHMSLNKKIVIHTHPVYLNVILCSKQSKKIIDELFSFLNYEYINYSTPGYKLCNLINGKTSEIFFLENHGLIVCGNDLKTTIKLTKKINKVAEIWINKNIENYVEYKNNFKNKILFPDSIVFKEELKLVNNHILNLIIKCSLTPKFLDDSEISEILNLEYEKLRIKNNL